MKGWMRVFSIVSFFAVMIVLMVGVSIFFLTDDQIVFGEPEKDLGTLLIIDDQAEEMIDRFKGRIEDDSIEQAIGFFIMTPEADRSYDAEGIEVIAVSYTAFKSYPQLAEQVRSWIAQGKRIYLYGDEMKSALLEKEIGIALERKSSEKKAKGEIESSYQIIGYQKNELPTAFFGNILIADQRVSNDPYESPTVAPDAFLQTILLHESRQQRQGMPRNDGVVDLEKGDYQLRVQEDWISTLFWLREEGDLLLLADMTTGVNLYQRLNENSPDEDLFFLTHGTEVSTYNGARSKDVRVRHHTIFGKVNLLWNAPLSQTGEEMFAKIDQDVQWSFQNNEEIVLKEDASMNTYTGAWTATWFVKPHWWQFSLGERTMLVPGTYWNSPGTYTALNITEQSTINYSRRGFNLNSKRTLYYNYETGNVSP